MYKYLFSLAIIICLASCGDDPICSNDDFAGIYAGPLNCVSGESVANDTVIVRLISSTEIEVDINQRTFEGELDGCTLDLEDSVSGFSGTASLDSTTISIAYSLSLIHI